MKVHHTFFFFFTPRSSKNWSLRLGSTVWDCHAKVTVSESIPLFHICFYQSQRLLKEWKQKRVWFLLLLLMNKSFISNSHLDLKLDPLELLLSLDSVSDMVTISSLAKNLPQESQFDLEIPQSKTLCCTSKLAGFVTHWWGRKNACFEPYRSQVWRGNTSQRGNTLCHNTGALSIKWIWPVQSLLFHLGFFHSRSSFFFFLNVEFPQWFLFLPPWPQENPPGKNNGSSCFGCTMEWQSFLRAIIRLSIFVGRIRSGGLASWCHVFVFVFFCYSYYTVQSVMTSEWKFRAVVLSVLSSITQMW